MLSPIGETSARRKKAGFPMTIRKAAIAGAWSTADIVLRQGVGFAVTIILARLLTPEDFGTVALLTFFSSLSIVFVQGGLSAALIQRQSTSRDEESTVFWCNLAAGALFALALIAIAPLVARFYGYPVLAPMMLAAAGQVLLSALGSVQAALLTRNLEVGQLTKAGVGSSLMSGLLGVVAAMMGAGVWALVVQMVSGAAVYTAILWLVSDWRPLLRFRVAALGPLFRFGLNVGVANLSDVLYTQGFALIVGKLHGIRELGLYNRAYTTQLFPSGIFSAIIGRLALPLFAERAEDGEALRRGVRMATSLAMLLNVPAMVGLALTSDLIIQTLFGDQWMPAVPILSVLAIGGVLLPMHVINLQLLLAQGRSDLFLTVEISKKTVGIACVVVGSLFGIMGLAYSQVVFSVFALWFNCRFTKSAIDYGLLRQIVDVAGIGFATAAMSAVVIALRSMIDAGSLSELAIVAGAGALTYFGLGLLLRLHSFREGMEIVAMVVRRKRAGPT
jgi:O-antigen/teichoic acid export membrane protein